ncbi:hypothetical protein ACT4UM_18935, partial [Bacillus sp. SS-TM]
MKRKTLDIPVTLRREWFLIELAHLTKKYGIEIATSKMDAAPFFFSYIIAPLYFHSLTTSLDALIKTTFHR